MAEDEAEKKQKQDELDDENEKERKKLKKLKKLKKEKKERRHKRRRVVLEYPYLSGRVLVCHVWKRSDGYFLLILFVDVV